MSSSPTFLVTGAGGHLGRLVVERLLAAKAGKVIAASRDPAKLADLAAKGAETRRADFDDPASLDAAFKGVDRLLIISTDDARHARQAPAPAHGGGRRGGARQCRPCRLHLDAEPRARLADPVRARPLRHRAGAGRRAAFRTRSCA